MTNVHDYTPLADRLDLLENVRIQVAQHGPLLESNELRHIWISARQNAKDILGREGNPPIPDALFLESLIHVHPSGELIANALTCAELLTEDATKRKSGHEIDKSIATPIVLEMDSPDTTIEPQPALTEANNGVLDLAEFTPDLLRERVLSVLRSTTIELSEFGYAGHWTSETIAGLAKVDMRGKRVVEVGVGPGTVAIVTSALHNPEILEVSDYVGGLTLKARENAEKVLPACLFDSLIFHDGQCFLAEKIQNGKQKVDVLYACIPQMGRPAGVDLDTHRNDYFDRQELAERNLATAPISSRQFNVQTQPDFLKNVSGVDFDLDLILALLKQVEQQDILAEDGCVCLTLGGRPGEHVLTELVEREGWNVEIVHRGIIRQDEDTDIQSIVDHESQLKRIWRSYSFKFYNDQQGASEIGAEQAQKLIGSEQPVFHDIFVIRATLDHG